MNAITSSPQDDRSTRTRCPGAAAVIDAGVHPKEESESQESRIGGVSHSPRHQASFFVTFQLQSSRIGAARDANGNAKGGSEPSGVGLIKTNCSFTDSVPFSIPPFKGP